MHLISAQSEHEEAAVLVYQGQQRLDVESVSNENVHGECHREPIGSCPTRRLEIGEPVALVLPEFFVLQKMPGRFKRFPDLRRAQAAIEQRLLGRDQQVLPPDAILLRSSAMRWKIEGHAGRFM